MPPSILHAENPTSRTFFTVKAYLDRVNRADERAAGVEARGTKKRRAAEA
jgi:hypothetical protein